VASFISANKGSHPCYEEDTVAPKFGETLVHVYAAFTELFSSKLVSSTFFTRGRGSLNGSYCRKRRAKRWRI